MIRSIPALIVLGTYAILAWIIVQPTVYVAPALERAAINLIRSHR